ncbi:MAG: hypothetical protein AAFQ40_14605 [Cyanobacteria bacterium J06623_5]
MDTTNSPHDKLDEQRTDRYPPTDNLSLISIINGQTTKDASPTPHSELTLPRYALKHEPNSNAM